MHIYFVGIGGTAIGPLALIAQQYGCQVSGSDKRDSLYIDYLKKHGVTDISISEDEQHLKELHARQPVDWLVYSSAIGFEHTDHPQLAFAKKAGIKLSKRDELLSHIIEKSGQKLIAIAGTHGKTTTSAMTVWLLQQLGIPVSYSFGAKTSFSDMGLFDPEAEYFVYECDEFDRNFLAFHPHLSIITGVDYDHHEIFPTRQDYQDAFRQFFAQSTRNIMWHDDMTANKFDVTPNDIVIHDDELTQRGLSLVGEVNRRNAWQVICTVRELCNVPIDSMVEFMNDFPGLSRRFEKIADQLYSDYAHTPPKIAGCLQLAREVSDNVVVVYEPLTNRRQHHIKDTYKQLFSGVKKLYWVPSYLAREDPDLPVLSPDELIQNMDNPEIAEPAELNDALKTALAGHIAAGDLVVCISGGGGESLDEWLRQEFQK